MTDPRVQALPEAPYYQGALQPQSAIGVFVVGDATGEFSRTTRLIDFSGGAVVGLAAGDASWSSWTLDGPAQMIVVSTTLSVLFAIGADVDLVEGPMLLTPGAHYFRVLPDTDETTPLHWRTLEDQGAGTLTINKVTA